MTPIAFYRTSIWLPVAASGLSIIGVQLFGQPIDDRLSELVWLLALSGYFGGIPYIILAAWATRALKGQSEVQARRLAWRMPFYMLPFCAVYLVIFVKITEGSVPNGLFLAAMATAYVLPIGYAYAPEDCHVDHRGIFLRT